MDDQDLVTAFIFNCSVERRLSENTTRAYTSDLHDFKAFANNKDWQSGITANDLRAYLAHLLGARGCSVATARRRIACLKAFCGFAAKEKGIPDPFKDWSPQLRRPKRLPRALSRPEMTKLVAPQAPLSAIDRETISLVLIFSATGVRISELCNVRVCDVNTEGSALRIAGKGSRERIVYVSDARLQNEIVDARDRALQDQGPNGWLFVNSHGRQLQPQTLRRRLHTLAERLNLDRKITPHMLRHTAATLLIEGGVDIRFVQRLLGHASIATTEIYTHVSDASLKNAVCSANVVGEFVEAKPRNI